MKKYLDFIFVASLVLFIVSYFSLKIWPHSMFDQAVSFFGMTAFLSVVPTMSRKALVMPSVIIVLSLLIVSFTSSSFVIFWGGFREMKEVLPLVILVSLLEWLVGHKPYVQALFGLGRGKIKTSVHVYSFATTVSHLVSSFMTVGGIPFVYQLLKGKKQPDILELAWEFTLSTAILRGFTVSVLWTAVHPAFAYVVAGTDAPLIKTMLLGMGLAAIGLVIGLLIFILQYKKMGFEPNFYDGPKDEETVDKKLVFDFFVWIGILMAMIFYFHIFIGMEILVTVPVVILIVTFLYFLWNRSMKKYSKMWGKLIRDDLKTKRGQVLFILSAGLLVSALKKTGFGETLFQTFLKVITWLHLDLLIGLSIIVILLGFAGLPPVPAMVLLSGILTNLPPGYPTELISLSLLLGVSVTLVIAPITVPLLLISGQNGRSLFQNGFVWNIIFGITLLVVGQIYLQMLK
jgi:hypothetical protein